MIVCVPPLTDKSEPLLVVDTVTSFNLSILEDRMISNLTASPNDT